VATFFLHTSDLAARRVPSVKPTPFQALSRIYGDLDWMVPDLLDQCRTAHNVLFDAVEQIRMPRWSRRRVVLIRDASWCVSPLPGQGASMAVAGAYVLAEELRRAASVDVALARYEQRLRPAITRQQNAARRIAKWFVPDSEFRLIVRDLATRLSTWSVVAPILRRRMAARSIFSNR
jgi:2-polyprenyl-6-methoxyphenol hydroxylase-like FAD-dependent oxidoreductase